MLRGNDCYLIGGVMTPPYIGLLPCVHDARQIDLTFIVRIELAVLHGDGRQYHGLDMPVHQQIHHPIVRHDTCRIAIRFPLATASR